MPRSAGSKESYALRSRHKSFFKRLDLFLKDYARGVCGNGASGTEPPSRPGTNGGAEKLRG